MGDDCLEEGGDGGRGGLGRGEGGGGGVCRGGVGPWGVRAGVGVDGYDEPQGEVSSSKGGGHGLLRVSQALL